jgi:hypothetical protein
MENSLPTRQKRPNGPFDVRISERQRRLIVRMLAKALENDDFVLELLAEHDPSPVASMGNALQQAQELSVEFADLPWNNVEGQIHGLLHASER